ncbi:MAG: hypothetical protein K2I30_00455 [Clostridia bacterium]|nr:hypothetical protein [Clostridia bacterium]
MKRRYAVLAIIYAIAMFGVIFLGSYLGMPWLWKLGIGLLFGGSFLIAMITTIVIVVRAVKKSGEQTDVQPDGEDITDEDIVDEIIDDNDEVNPVAVAEHEISNAVNEYKASSRKEKIFGIVLIAVLLACIIGGAVSFSFNQIVGGVLIGAFVLIIISCIVVTSIKQRIAMSGRGVRANAPIHEATVIACTRSSQTTVMGRTTVVYKLRLDLDGMEKVTYSKNYYDVGETVSVRGDLYDKRIALVEDSERYTPYPSYLNYFGDTDEDTDDFETEDYNTED